MSSRPNFSMAKSTIAFTSASFAMSPRTNAASPPSFLISATTCAPSFSRRPVNTTLAPARANAIAVALPMPEVPPVTSATFPSNFPFFIFVPFILLVCNSSAHREDDAEADLAAVHLFVGFGRATERKFLDHWVDAGQRAEFQCVLRIARGAGIPAGDLAATHQ